MARIFNIYFTYDEILHNAIVSVRSTPFSTEYVLGNLDDELQELLPSNVITATDTEMRFQNSTGGHPRKLMYAIIKSIAAHLHTGNDVATGL